MDKLPRVSVLMPVYNAGRYVRATVESLLAQTFADFELIAIDDGSKDDSAAVVREMAATDARIRFTSRENRGVVRTRNELADLARGEFMAVNDADDLSMPDRLAKQVAYLDAHPECVMVGSRVMVMDPYSSPVAESAHKLGHEEIDAELLAGSGWALVQSAVMMRSEAVRKIGGYRGAEHNLSEDHDIFIRLAEVGRIANLPEPLVWYRRHATSLTHTLYQSTKSRHEAVKRQIIEEAYQRRGRSMPADWAFETWRPSPRDEQLRTWGWAAIKHKNIPVARKHAVAAVKAAPLSGASWKLLYCALRGR
ncbi:MAG: glycosyl transferase family 2 [Phycisphaerales bacterium]|nr:glycosyl transferase family 2 [Phycisphaerales bacterium]